MMLGADPERLDEIARQFESAASTLSNVYQVGRRAAHSNAWMGADAEQFRQQWDGVARARITSAEQVLSSAARALRTNAAAQRRKSAASSGAWGDGVASGTGSGADTEAPIGSEPKTELEEWLGVGKGLQNIQDLSEVPHLLKLLAEQRKFEKAWGLGPMTAEQFRTLAHQSKFARVGGLGLLLSGTEVLTSLREHGIGDSRSWDAIVGGIGSSAASFATPLGSVAWMAGYDGGKWVLHATGGDVVLGSGGYNLAYGGHEMTPAEAAEVTRRTQNPVLVTKDLAVGTWQRVNRWWH